MLIIFKELTNKFEQTLLDSLKQNDKEREFEILRKNIITQSSKEEFGDYQCNVCLSLSKIYKKNPREFIAQPLEILSTAPTITKNDIEPRHLDLRPFVLSGKSTYVTTGGLTRVALRKGSTIVNSSQGGGSKDTLIVDI